MDGDHHQLRAIFFLPAEAFQHDPILGATLVFVNLPAAFLSPPGDGPSSKGRLASPSAVTRNQIFCG